MSEPRGPTVSRTGRGKTTGTCGSKGLVHEVSPCKVIPPFPHTQTQGPQISLGCV